MTETLGEMAVEMRTWPVDALAVTLVVKCPTREQANDRFEELAEAVADVARISRGVRTIDFGNLTIKVLHDC